MFFSAIYIFNSFVLKAVLSVINIHTLSIPYLSPVLTLSISPLLAFKATFNVDFVVIELSFILKAIYNHSLTG